MKKLLCSGVALLVLFLSACGGPAKVESGACCAPGDAKPGLTLKAGAKNVGVVIFSDVFITEFVAPFDVYKHAGDKLNVFTVAPTTAAIRTYEGVVVHPDFSFENAPKIDVLVVPSGNGSLTMDLKSEALVGFVKWTAAQAEFATSHCWGCFTLAEAGCLDGRECTTFPTSVDDLQKMFPSVKAQKEKRFVVSGKYITSNGGLAAYEAALHVVEKLFGRETADKVASGLVYAADNRKSGLGLPQ
jgi:transcriptional regulator GlxA family with amidase domain